jgi:polyhydroxybutyrate depolymerase
MSPLALARNHPDPRYDSTDSNNIGKSCVWVAGDALAPSRLNILSGDSERRISMKRVLRFVVRGLAGVVALGCVLGALLAYFVYTPAPEVPPLSGALVKRTIAVGGLERTYRTYVPRGLAAGAPLVVVMHGSGENGAQMREETGYGFDRLADKHRFAVIYPSAVEGLWDACSITGKIIATGKVIGSGPEIDDIGFLTAAIDRTIAEIGSDPKRVFATGASRGGSMAIRLALEAPSRFRAVAAVSANVPSPENFKCKPAGKSTSSVMIMNGTKDPLVPFDGGEVNLLGLFYRNGKVMSARQSAEYFAKLNGIPGPPGTSEVRSAFGLPTRHFQWRKESGAEVELVAIEGGGHGITQPYRRNPRILGPSLKEPNAPELIWAFFERQQRRGDR